jgi:hypothetical protein
MQKFKFQMNAELKDVVSGYKGIVMVRCEYSTGCRHYGLAAPIDKDGKLPAWEYFDESRLISTGRILEDLKSDATGRILEDLKSDVIKIKPPSGPMPNAPQW